MTMRLFVALSCLALVFACEKKGNQELYNEVMAIHDEVMPKMDNIRNYKKEFKAELTNNPTITEARKAELEAIIVKLDSADNGMRVWMREFEPIGDDQGEEKAREYLENQKKLVQKVKDDILSALEKAQKLKTSAEQPKN